MSKTHSDDGEPGSDPPTEDNLQSKLDEILSHVDPKAGLDDWSPQKGVDKYLDKREEEISEKTYEEYEDELAEFIGYCEMRDIDPLHELSKANMTELDEWYRTEVPTQVKRYGPKTTRDFIYLIRNFIQYLEDQEVVKEGLHIYLEPPELDSDDGVSDEFLEGDRAQNILDYLSTYEYATIDHAVWALLTAFGGRRGTIRAIDKDDCILKEEELDDGEKPYIELEHRPEQGTPLKNGKESAREVVIDRWIAELLRDYIAVNRKDKTDEYGRKPLLTTRYGRISVSTISKYAYKWTRPCKVSRECPHNRTEADCEAAKNIDHASKCPSSKSPHTSRKGYITEEAKAGTPDDFLSERCDVSEEVLEKHYKQLNEAEKRKLRQKILEAIKEERDGYVS